ncbi:MAG: ATP-binding cassette domain-containing protein, partial [Pseudomonadota bacterium]
MAVGKEILKLDSLTKSFFGVEVLHQVGFTLHEGEILGLVGENGSGKSTTMNILGGIHQPDSGTLQFAGQAYRPSGPKDAQ